ncbi:hypothetical protein K0O13_06840 [Mammaliicoccus sciuri]|uniref:hypothetical protein n=1 Tax=Mammaliicoccus sciuri TaxID=1296 RepID=UPI001C6336B9|nr:hypothetical protein [Mammaliicoccus sciuri]MCD8798112.1 hypothetical protein [Mammaliicoccus sciuri]QYG32547.1 hypothetical protein K0O13_06840 [Mammaliicoccus sciuri]
MSSDSNEHDFLGKNHEKWNEIYKKTKDNETEFKSKINDYKSYEQHIKNTINLFLENEEGIKENTIVKVDMTKIRSSYKDLDSYINVVLNEVREILNVYEDDHSSKKDDDKQEYIYVVQRQDGMVAVVGRSSFKYIGESNGDLMFKPPGDLFHNMDISGIIGTPRLILMSLLGEIYNEYAKTINEYYQTGWIIPIPGDYNKANELEKKLGDFMKDNGVPIFNENSHKR